MRVTAMPEIEGAYLFEPEPQRDHRGFFSRTFDVQIASTVGIAPDRFVQDSLSRSHCGVRRGLHLRAGAGEAKLVRCSYGRIFDVVVDLRATSATWGGQLCMELCDQTQRTLYVPAGCAHGFQALTEPADVSYRIDRAHDPAEDITIDADDPQLAIAWPLPPTGVSERDRQGARLADVLTLLATAP